MSSHLGAEDVTPASHFPAHKHNDSSVPGFTIVKVAHSKATETSRNAAAGTAHSRSPASWLHKVPLFSSIAPVYDGSAWHRPWLLRQFQRIKNCKAWDIDQAEENYEAFVDKIRNGKGSMS